MAELSIPVATVVGAEMTKHPIYETIKALRDSYMEFCEDEDEFITTIVPIEQDPEPYANGTKKTRPILKKYAQALVDKKDLEEQLEAEAEAQRDIHLTPQQVKADVKRYVSICEKKIAKQQEQCDALQKQVEQLSEVVRCIVLYNNSGYGQLISQFMQSCMLDNIECLRFFISKLENKEKISEGLSYAIYSKKIENVKILIEIGANVNYYGELRYIDNTKQHTPLMTASRVGSLEIVKLLIEKGATIENITYHVPNGPEGDLVAGYLQTHGSKPVTRF